MTRGRKPEGPEHLATSGPFMPAARPEPPADLVPPEAADEWRAITARLPAEWFTAETLPILRELCAHLVYARRLREGIERAKSACEAAGKDWALDPEWRGKASLLWQEHRYQTQQIGSLATKLRLTQQSRYAADRADTERTKIATTARKPWEEWTEDRPPQ